jgi:septal ring-binding cell division protein DamX
LPILLAAVLGVSLATVAAWYLFLRNPTPARTALATPAATPVPSTMPPATPPVPAATPQGTAVPAGASPATPVATTATTATAAPARPTPAPTALPSLRPPAPVPAQGATAAPAGRAAGGDARDLLGRGVLPEAARAFARTLAPGARTRFSLQLLTACAPETVQKAVGATGGTELFILPVTLQGRNCYRVCWGVYDTRQTAEAGLSTVPAYFRESGVRPRLSPLSELLP